MSFGELFTMKESSTVDDVVGEASGMGSLLAEGNTLPWARAVSAQEDASLTSPSRSTCPCCVFELLMSCSAEKPDDELGTSATV